MIRMVSGIVLLGLSLAFVGCGGPTGFEVTGKATKKGAAFTPGAGESVVVLLEGQEGQQYDGKVGADGTFKIMGTSGVAPGNYKVSYMRYVPNAKGPPKPVPVDTTWSVAADKREFTLEIK